MFESLDTGAETGQKTTQEKIASVEQEAQKIIDNALPILEKVKQSPQNKNLHDQKTGGMWMGQWLGIQKDRVRELYNTPALAGLLDMPAEVKSFVQDIEKIIIQES
jgi:hypothetical protein